MSIDPKLLDLLCCPACEGRPKVRLEGNILYCDKCRREYPVEDDLPIMLPENTKIREEA